MLSTLVAAVIAAACPPPGDPPAAPSVCQGADYNDDGKVDSDDLTDFIACYFLQLDGHTHCRWTDCLFHISDDPMGPDQLADFIALYFDCAGGA